MPFIDIRSQGSRIYYSFRILSYLTIDSSSAGYRIRFIYVRYFVDSSYILGFISSIKQSRRYPVGMSGIIYIIFKPTA